MKQANKTNQPEMAKGNKREKKRLEMRKPKNRLSFNHRNAAAIEETEKEKKREN